MNIGNLTALRPHLSVETKPSVFDRMSAAMVASIMLLGFLFAVLLTIWYTAMPFVGKGWPEPVPPGSEVIVGISDDPLEPGVEEFPELATPQLAKTLLAVTDAVSTVTATHVTKDGHAKKLGFGFGDGFKRLPAPAKLDTIPEYKRWVIQYEAEDIDTYAKQLSFFKIDIGVIHATKNKIWRVHDVGGTPKVIPSDRKKENLTLRFQHKKPRLRRWDQELCRRAKVDLTETVQSQFYPHSTRDAIRLSEAKAIAVEKIALKQVARTTVKVVPQGDGFEFKVIDIQQR